MAATATPTARRVATEEAARAAAEAPFKDADCYGSRVANCLAANPAVDALASAPELCMKAERHVCLVPIGFVRADIVEEIIAFHRRTAGIDVLVLPSIVLDQSLLASATSQVSEKALWNLLKSTYGVTGDTTSSTYIAITPFDVRPADGRYAWMFGARYGASPLGHNHGVFSYFRMATVPPYNGQPITVALVQERATKYFARYVALLYLDYEMTTDKRYLNYYEMYGFRDLDSMQPNWPPYAPACLGGKPTICVVPDSGYTDDAFEDDVRAAAAALAVELGLSIEVRPSTPGFVPSLPDWGDEFAHDLFKWRGLPGERLDVPSVTIVGITDDRMAHSPGIADRLDLGYPEERLAVTSGFGAGTPGTVQHRTRIKQALYRAIALAKGVPLDDTPGSLMFRGVTTSAELDGATAPRIP